MSNANDRATRTVAVKLTAEELAWLDARVAELAQRAQFSTAKVMDRNRDGAMTRSSYLRLLVQRAMRKLPGPRTKTKR